MVGDWDGLLGLPHCSHWTIGNDIIAIQWYYIMFFLSIAIRYPWYGGWLQNPAPVGKIPWTSHHLQCFRVAQGLPCRVIRISQPSTPPSGPPFPGKTLASFSWWTTTTWPSFPVMDGYWKWIELRDIQNIHLSQHKIWTDTSCYYVIYG